VERRSNLGETRPGLSAAKIATIAWHIARLLRRDRRSDALLYFPAVSPEIPCSGPPAFLFPAQGNSGQVSVSNRKIRQMPGSGGENSLHQGISPDATLFL
jgi:hypothetical protein